MRGESGLDLFMREKLEAAARGEAAAGGDRQDESVGAGDRRPVHGNPAGHGNAEAALWDRDAAPRYLDAFVEEMKASGFVAEALARSNQPDAAVAPPAAN